MTRYAPAERLLVLTFYGILNSEMSFWDKTGVTYAEGGEFGAWE